LAEEAGPRKHAGSCLATLRPDSNTDFSMSDSLLGGPFEFVSYQEVDINQRAEFEALLKKVGASNGIWLLLASRLTHNVQLPCTEKQECGLTFPCGGVIVIIHCVHLS